MTPRDPYIQRYTIHVAPEGFRKIRRVEKALNRMGISFGRVMRRPVGPDPWQIAGHIWLSVSIAGGAIGAYRKIRKILKEHDFSDREIITLDLYKHLQQPKRKRRTIKRKAH